MQRHLPIITILTALIAPAWAAEYHPIPLKQDPAFALDGDLSEWPAEAPPIRIDTKEQLHVGPTAWSGPADLSATIRLAWRNEGVYLAAEVSDDMVSQSQRAGLIYKGDHLEFFLDVTPDADTGRKNWGDGQFQFGLSPGNFKKTGDPLTDVKPEAFCFRPEGGPNEGAQVAAARTATGYTLEALIPFGLMGVGAPRQNLPIHCEVALSDCDSPEPAQETYMTIGTASWRHTRDRLQPMILADVAGKATPPPAVHVIAESHEMAHSAKSELAFTPPPTPDGKAAYLRLLTRINSPKAAGYTPALRLFLNDKPVDGTRLMNRPLVSLRRNGHTHTFMTAAGLITVPYGPDFAATDKDANYGLADTPRACEYELLVTDLLQAGENRLRFETGADPKGQWRFFFGDVAVLFKAPPAPKPERKPAPTGEIPVIAPRLEFPRQYAIEERPAATLRVTINGESFDVQSRFSSPDGKWNNGPSAFYSHTRRIEQGDEGILVFDTFRNLTDENLPLMQRHECAMGDRLAKVWIAGASPFSKEGSQSQPSNPTVYGVTGAVGIGLMPMSDEFQVHVANYCLAGVLGVADNQYVLRPGAEYTAEWAIIPTASTDFWDFINAARRVRDANFTLPNQFAFLSARETFTDDFLRNFMANKSPGLVCASINYPLYKGVYAHGTAFQRIDHSGYAKHNERIRQMFPDVKTSIYYHCFLDVTEDGPQVYADSRTLRPDGTQATYGKPHDKIYFPTLENSFGRDTAKNVEQILGDCGADGVYWDELAYSAYQYHYGEPWDGCSGDIDANTHKLVGLKTSVTLISQPFRTKLLKRILDDGRPFIANGQPHTRTEAALKFQRFVETAAISNCLRAVLYSPIALGDHISERTEVDAYRWMLGALDYGCVYNWYSEGVATMYPTLTEHMFPITPMELHEGYIIGRERIITKKSGYFGWGDAAAHEVHVYNEVGKEVPDFAAPTVLRDGKSYTELRLPEDFSAAIIRK